LDRRFEDRIYKVMKDRQRKHKERGHRDGEDVHRERRHRERERT